MGGGGLAADQGQPSTKPDHLELGDLGNKLLEFKG